MTNEVNHCLYLNIQTAKKRKEFLAQIGANERCIDFNRLIPQPEGVAKGQPTHDWRVENWGVGWNAHETKININQNGILIRFKTVWNTPQPIIDQIICLLPRTEIVHWYAAEFDGFFPFGFESGVLHRSSNELGEMTTEKKKPDQTAVFRIMQITNKFFK